MVEFFSQNLGNIIVGGIVLLIVGFATYRLIRNRRSGKSCCGCSVSGGCAGCSCCSGAAADKKPAEKK